MTSQSGDLWIVPRQVFDGQSLRQGAVCIRDGKVMSVEHAAPEGARTINSPHVLTPGLIDLQVNGGGGVLFNKTPTVDGILKIAAAHRSFGTTGILPTVITDDPSVLGHAVAAIIEAWGNPGILGIHIEGPHLSVARRGTHAERFIRPMDDSTLSHVERLRSAGVPVMITVAPEAATASQITELARMGAVVSLGHTDASEADTNLALAAGATCFTHLFNAMSPMLNRAPGVTGAAISSAAYTGVICDGIHVADTMIALAMRARPLADRMFLVSDAMPTVGGPDEFELYDMHVRLDAGQLINDEGSLAGAHLTMAEALARMITHVGADPEVALRMATSIPARLMGHHALAGLIGQSVEDVLLLDEDWGLAGPVARILG